MGSQLSSRLPRHVFETHAIRHARHAQNQAMAAGNVMQAATCWANDVIMRRASGQQLVGKAAYIALLAQLSGADPLVIYWRQIVEVLTSECGTVAFETGTWQATLGSLDGAIVQAGKYSAEWIKPGAMWLISAELFVPLSDGRDHASVDHMLRS